jgi:hypothetical protein
MKQERKPVPAPSSRKFVRGGLGDEEEEDLEGVLVGGKGGSSNESSEESKVAN